MRANTIDESVAALDALSSATVASQAAFARAVRLACDFVDRAGCRPAALSPGATFDAEAAEKSAVAEVAARLAVSGSTVTEQLGLYRTARPSIRDAFDAGRLPYGKFRTLCRTLNDVPAVTEDLLERLLSAAERCTPGSLTAALDRIIAEHHADWHREARTRADAERSVTIEKLPRGQARMTLRGPAAKIADLTRTVVDHAVGRLCGLDSRSNEARMFDAAHALITGGPLVCDCGREECTRRSTDAPGPAEPHAHIVIDAAVAAGLSGEPAQLLGWGEIPADVARRIAQDATWQAIIEAARHGTSLCSRCESTGPDKPTDPPHAPIPAPQARRTRRFPAGWSSTAGSTARSRAHRRMQRELDHLRRIAGTSPHDIEFSRTHDRGHGGFDAPPPGATTYRPSDALALVVQATYPTCVHPGCTVPSTECDLDHAVPFDHRGPERGGWTIATNLEPLCRHHHGLKTRGQWTYEILKHGIVHVQDSLGNHYFTAPSRARG